jgi:hypothetical protein
MPTEEKKRRGATAKYKDVKSQYTHCFTTLGCYPFSSPLLSSRTVVASFDIVNVLLMENITCRRLSRYYLFLVGLVRLGPPHAGRKETELQMPGMP